MEQIEKLQTELSRTKKLEGLFVSTLSAFARTGQIDRGLLSYGAKAIELAFSLFPKEEIAFQIALDAVLNVRRIANEKEHYRRYYKGSKKTKILSSRVQLFQQMIWCESQKWEKYQETDYLIEYLSCCDQETHREDQISHNLRLEELEQKLELNEIEHDTHLSELIEQLKSVSFDERDMVVRYLEFLVQGSLDNNSSYVTFVISNMVYDYSLPRVTDICAFLNPDAIGGQYLYTLKSKLILRIKERFGILIDLKSDEVNDCFNIQEDRDGQLSEFVKQCRCSLIPWETECLADGSRPQKRSFDDHLYNWLDRVDNEDQKEMHRAHIVICPSCYEKLIAGCRIKGRSVGEAEKLPPPRLAIPRFKIPIEKGNKQMPKIGGDHQRIELGGESKSIEKSLLSPPATLMQMSSSLKELLVFVDGEKRGDLDLQQSGTIRLNLNEGARLIKVMSQSDQGLTLLAALLLRRREIESSLLHRLLGWKNYSISLENGGKIAFAVKFSESGAGDGTFIVDISHRKSPAKAMLLLWQSIQQRISELSKQHWMPVLRPAQVFGLVLIVACALGFLYYNFLRKQTKPNEQAKVAERKNETKKQEPPLPPPEPEPSKLNGEQPNKDNSPSEKVVIAKQKQKRPASNSNNGDELNDTTMSASQPDGVDLSAVERIYVDPFGDDPLPQELRELLKENLTRGKFDLPEKRTSADAVLHCSLKERLGKQTVEVKLINRDGNLLLKREFLIGKDLADVAIRIIDYLIGEKERSKTHHKDHREP